MMAQDDGFEPSTRLASAVRRHQTRNTNRWVPSRSQPTIDNMVRTTNPLVSHCGTPSPSRVQITKGFSHLSFSSPPNSTAGDNQEPGVAQCVPGASGYLELQVVGLAPTQRGPFSPTAVQPCPHASPLHQWSIPFSSIDDTPAIALFRATPGPVRHIRS